MARVENVVKGLGQIRPQVGRACLDWRHDSTALTRWRSKGAKPYVVPRPVSNAGTSWSGGRDLVVFNGPQTPEANRAAELACQQRASVDEGLQ